MFTESATKDGAARKFDQAALARRILKHPIDNPVTIQWSRKLKRRPEDNPLLGRHFIAMGVEWEAITAPAWPTYGGDHMFVWGKPIKAVGKVARGVRLDQDRVHFLPLKWI